MLIVSGVVVLSMLGNYLVIISSIAKLKAQAESLDLSGTDVAHFILSQQALESEERDKERKEREKEGERE